MENLSNTGFNQHLLIRFFANETTESENKAIYEWIQSSDENKAAFMQQKALWNHASIKWTDSISTETEFAALQEKIEAKNSRLRFLKSRKSLAFQISRVAAILVILLTVGWFGKSLLVKPESSATLGNLTEIIIPIGQRGQITLEDGTKVWINADTRLKYPAHFNEKTREVYLEGEAYFEVAHNKQKPFLVHTSSIEVKVLGTKFNVKSYKNDLKTETTVAEGCVSVAENAKQKNGNTAKAVKLLANDKAVLNQDANDFKLEKTNASLATAWTTGEISFDEKSLDEIARILERQFDFVIVVENKAAKDNIYTATFEKGKTCEEILFALMKSSDFTYKITGKTITIH